jgi:hypothetical protein
MVLLFNCDAYLIKFIEQQIILETFSITLNYSQSTLPKMENPHRIKTSVNLLHKIFLRLSIRISIFHLILIQFLLLTEKRNKILFEQNVNILMYLYIFLMSFLLISC